MANIRQDQAQLIITIDAKESLEYQKTLQNTAKGVQDIKKLTAGTDEYNKVLNEQADISRKLSQSDFTKLSGKQLADRRSQLIQLQKILPGVTFAEAGFERELRQVNTALATNAQRTRAVSQEMRDVAPAVNGFGAGFKKALGFLAPFGIIEGIRQIGGALFGLAKDSVNAFDEAAKAEAQLEAAIKSTGAAAGKSVEELVAQSAELQKITLYSDDQIQESQGLLLTFTKVGGAIYDQAIPAIADMATAMKSDLSTASIQVGKALNDPVKGVTALSKAGVQFTQDQKDMIKQLVASGDTVGAQTIILKELETQFQGSAKAAADAGLGPLQQFQNRIDDIKEGIGLLITNGLGFLGPILDSVATFAEKFVGVLVTGDKATGRFSGAVNFLVGALRITGNVISFVSSEVSRWYTGMVNLFNVLKDLPLIGSLVKGVAASFSFIVDAVSNTTAVIAGMKAAFQQTFDNVANYIKSTLLTLKIFAKEAELLFTIGGDARDKLKSEIKLLESLKADASKAGKTVAQAYSDAYNDTLKKEALANKIVNSTKPVKVIPPGSGGGGGDNDKSKKELSQAEKEAAALLKKKLELQAKERDALLAFNPLNPEFAQGVLDLRLKMLEDAAAREQLALEESYLQGEISLEQYELEKLRITSANLATRIELLDAYGQSETDKRKELNIELLKVESDIIKERAAQIGELENAQLTELENKFANRLITEQEYNLSRLRVQLNFYDEQLRLLEENGLIETEVYKKIQAERLKTQIDYNKQTTDNEQKTADLKKAIANEGIGIAKEIFSLGADLLAQDEKARRKHATAIKAFETASIFVNSLAEIAENYKQSAKLGPIAGPIVGTARAIFTAVRAGIAIAKVNAQQFFLGGKIKTVSGQLIQERPNINPLPGGDNVLIAAKPGEVMFNEPQQENLKRLAGPDIFRRLGIPGFADGGLIPSLPRTTPTISPQVLSRNPAPIAADNGRIDMLLDAVQQITRSIPEAISAMDLKTHVVYTDFNKVQNTVNEIKRISRF